MTLEQIKDKLSECFKNHQAVLLYNDTSNKRHDLILTTHINNGGNLNDVYYVAVKDFEEVLRDFYYDEKRKINEGTLKSFDINIDRSFLAYIGDFLEHIRSQDGKETIRNKARKIIKSIKREEKSYKYLDCKGKGGNEVYKLLVYDGIWLKESASLPAAKTSSRDFWENYRENPGIIWGKQGHSLIDFFGSYLLHFKGMLFVDNLECDGSIEDNVSYRELADEIKENKVSVNWLVVYVHNRDNFPEPFLNQFDPISLDKKDKQQEGEDSQKKTEGQEIISVETTLSYDKTTGKFRFGKLESIAISPTPRAKVRNMATKLMKWWGKGKPCPWDEIVEDPSKITEQGVYDDTSKIRNALVPLNVNMPQSTKEGYPPPDEPKHFNIISKKVD